MRRQYGEQNLHIAIANRLWLNRIIFGSVAVLLLALLLNKLQAQDGKQANVTTATDDYLLRQQRNHLLKLMIYSNDPVEKRLTIQRLGQLVDQGKLQQDDLLTVNTLVSLAQQGTMQKSYDNSGNLINDDFPVRADACNLLGKLGGSLAKAGLLAVMQSDSDAVVVATAMENILKVDPQGSPTIVEYIVNTFYQYHYTKRDETLAYSFIYVAAAYVAESKGKLLSQDLLQAVHDVSLRNNVYKRFTRTKARSLILRWIGGNFPTLEELN